MHLRLRQLKISVMTEAGLYGRVIPFFPGLNVIHVENASGKSTCIQALIYALGLEAMLSPKHSVPLPHAVVEFLETATGQRMTVLESEVWLEVENSQGEIITVRRQIKGNDDVHLIRLFRGPQLSAPSNEFPEEPYFVRQSGAAQRPRGFHT